MKQNKINSPRVIVWHKFMRRSYSAFMSLHKVIAVGVLSVATLSTADLKAQTVMLAQTSERDTAELNYELDDVEVTGERVPLSVSLMPRVVAVMTKTDVQAAAVHSINDVLEYSPSVDVRQRGEMGVQTDISLRGGTFAQITVLLNGINITSPYCGHLSADFPVSLDEVERVEILEGPASRILGTSAFNGAINVVTKCDTVSHVAAHLFGGSYGYVGAEISGNYTYKRVRQQISGSFRRADGDQPNSNFDQTKFFYQGIYSSPTLDVSWQSGVSVQKFGANTFYSAAYPNQWEETTNWQTAVKAETKGVVHFSPSIYWNRQKDHFQLIKDSHTGENFHRVDVYGVNINGWIGYAVGKTAFGAELRSENIVSNNLGLITADSIPVRGNDNVYYNKKDARDNISYYVKQDFINDRWTLSLGAMAYRVTNSNNSMRLYPGIDVAFRPSEHWKLTASWNMATRLPSFLDLYYKSPTNEGNVNLKPEETSAVDVGARYRISGIEASASAYYQRGKNMMDWVMYTADDIFHSADFELDNIGAECNATLLPRELWGNQFRIRKIALGYAHIYQKRHDNVVIYKSNYALEYLRNKFTASIDANIVANLSANVNFRFQDRNGSYIKYDANHKSTGELVAYKPYSLVDMRLTWTQKHWSVYASANNLFNVEYYDLGNIPQPGIWLKLGLKVKVF
ncbi:MAG: TonB-dependent receptor [Bacteroidales bacterium]|nr:TonB-dependent receptor [Bacteroidales bacterium]